MLGIYLQRSWIVLFCCCFLLLPVYVFAAQILKLLGQPDDVAEMSGVVACWLIPLHFSFAFQFPLQRFLQSQLKNSVIAWVSLAGLLVNVLTSWLFVYVFDFGVVGAAVSLDISWWVLVFGLYGYAACGGCPLTWSGFSMEAFQGLWEFLKLSAASGVMLWYLPLFIYSVPSVSLTSFLFIILLILSFNVVVVADLQVQLGELVLQNTDINDGVLAECYSCCRCLVGLVNDLQLNLLFIH